MSWFKADSDNKGTLTVVDAKGYKRRFNHGDVFEVADPAEAKRLLAIKPRMVVEVKAPAKTSAAPAGGSSKGLTAAVYRDDENAKKHLVVISGGPKLESFPSLKKADAEAMLAERKLEAVWSDEIAPDEVLEALKPKGR
jgi:hypothetical protein